MYFQRWHNMKTKLLFLTLPLLVASLAACQDNKTYEFVVLSDAEQRTYIVGDDFNTEGFRAGIRCVENGKIMTDDVTFANDSDLELDQENIIVKINFKGEEYSLDYPITVKNQYHIACIGDSLTYGHMWTNQAYPVYLKQNVSERYDVGSFSYNGLSITGYGGSYNDPNQRYILRDEYKQSLAYKPDIFAIMLGTNDATGWANAEPTFYDEYCTLLNSYIEAFPNAKFIMMVSPPCIDNTFGIPNDVIKESVNPLQRDLAEEYEFEILDLREEFEAHENFETDYLRPNDGVHFTVAGAQYVAQRVWDIAKELKF